ncbi:MAG: hypothetical protein PWQ83_2059 [Thermosipho sp. (in: thermotogales)]|jgi:hypothetical protein|nr:hypothetical protein [Thermosipho sp. (in: thermotogales)]
MKVLVSGDLNSKHTKRVVTQLLNSKRFELISGITFANTRKNYHGINDLEHLYNEIYELYPTKVEKIRKIGIILQFVRNRNKIKKIVEKYDLINIQGITNHCINFLNINKPIISSFWGGDIWEKKQIYSKIIQRRMLKQSVLITVIHEKMKERVLKEFGSDLIEKIRIVKYFMLDTEKIDLIDNNDIEVFKNKFGIPLNNKIITISYSAAPRHRQNKILDILGLLNKDIIDRENIIFILPMTYGSKEWLELIRKKVLKHKFRNRIILLEEYLSDKDIATLRKITDIFINLPTQDSFSATMMEHLYAGSVVITGSWLPYDELFNSGAKILKITDFNLKGLNEILLDVINNLSIYKKENIKNKEIIKKVVFSSNWTDIFEEGLEIWKKRKK